MMRHMTADPARLVSANEYLAMEEAAESRNEFVGGIIRAMSGSTFAHAVITGNLIITLGGLLKGKPCRVVATDLKVKVELTGDYFYPDIVGFCGGPQFDKPTKVTILNPVLLIEVLSISTEGYDRGLKFLNYQQIPTLRQYVLVSQNEPRVEIYTREENSGWAYSQISGMEAIARLSSIDCAISLSDIYTDIDFEPQAKIGDNPHQSED